MWQACAWEFAFAGASPLGVEVEFVFESVLSALEADQHEMVM